MDNTTVESHLADFLNTLYYMQGDQNSSDTLKFPDISLTMCGTHAHVKWYS